MRLSWLDRRRLDLGLSSRLFLLLLAVGMITAIGTALATRLSFQQGFLAYLDQRELQRLEVMAISLATAWEANRNWDFIRDDNNRSVSQISILEFTADCRTGSALPRGLVLYDRQGQRIAGREDDGFNAIRQPILSRDELVGTLVGTPRRALSREAEQRFQQHQIQTSWVIGIAVASLAALLAAFLSRGFLAQVKHLNNGAMRMARGNYDARVRKIRNDELGMLAIHFNTMAAALQNDELMRRQFMADISHELRTPLAILRAELEAVEDGLNTVNSGSVRSLQAETKTLTRLVDDMRQLTPARIGELQYYWRDLDLAEILKEEQRVWHQQFAAQSLSMEIECRAEVMVYGDLDRLRQLLRNLIENTRRHAAGASLLRFLLHRDEDQALLECHDNGPGIAENLQDNLFKRFWRENRSGTVDGSGLGLAICRSIMIAHGGRIEAERSPLGGLCVKMYFPLRGVRK